MGLPHRIDAHRLVVPPPLTLGIPVAHGPAIS
jgi:hypothetical protein